MKIKIRSSVFLLSLFILFFLQTNTAVGATLTVCSGQPSTLHWSSSNIDAGGLKESASGNPVSNESLCFFSAVPGTTDSKPIVLTTGSCTVQLATASGGVSQTAILQVDPALGTWNSSSNKCVANTCPNGAIASSYPTCNQCPPNQAYISGACVACSGNPTPTGCSGAGGSAANPYGSLVCLNGASNPTTCDAFAPTASLWAVPSTIDSGQSALLRWSSTNASSCISAGGFSTGGATSNGVGVSTGALSATTPYAITCSGPSGSVNANTTVTVLQPSASISANPTRVTSGSSSTITWSASQVTSCAVSGPGLSAASLSGSQSVTITARSTYVITCQTNGTPVTSSVTVNTLSLFQEF